MNNLFVRQLREDPSFGEAMKHLVSESPVVEDYVPGGDPDVWKYQSGVREGYRLALSKLGVNLDE